MNEPGKVSSFLELTYWWEKKQQASKQINEVISGNTSLKTIIQGEGETLEMMARLA
jgi:hypothetical protein